MKHLTSEELMSGFFKWNQAEFEAMGYGLEYIFEINRRREYLKHKCTSIFEFLVKLGRYSKSGAQRRKDAVELAEAAPDLIKHLRAREINLSQISIVARLVREKEKSAQVSREIKRELIEAIRNKTEVETETYVCRKLDIRPKQIEIARVQADGSVRYEITFTKEEIEKMRRVRSLASHQHPSLTLSEYVMMLTDECLKRKDPAERPVAEVVATAAANPFYIPKARRRLIFQMQKTCQWKHKDGSLCGSDFQLEIDHIVRPAEGGTNDVSNLQLLCDAHNRMKYRVGA